MIKVLDQEDGNVVKHGIGNEWTLYLEFDVAFSGRLFVSIKKVLCL
jgi:hypothetical protein